MAFYSISNSKTYVRLFLLSHKLCCGGIVCASAQMCSFYACFMQFIDVDFILSPYPIVLKIGMF